jgi:hypothetical protein
MADMIHRSASKLLGQIDLRWFLEEPCRRSAPMAITLVLDSSCRRARSVLVVPRFPDDVQAAHAVAPTTWTFRCGRRPVGVVAGPSRFARRAIAATPVARPRAGRPHAGPGGPPSASLQPRRAPRLPRSRSRRWPCSILVPRRPSCTRPPLAPCGGGPSRFAFRVLDVNVRW